MQRFFSPFKQIVGAIVLSTNKNTGTFEFYTAVHELYTKIHLETQQNSVAHPVKVMDAARQLAAYLFDAMHDFNEALATDDELATASFDETSSSFNVTTTSTDRTSPGMMADLQELEALTTFMVACHKAIYTYQPRLMAAPGLLNYLKASINNVLESSNHHPVFMTNKSNLGLDPALRIPLNKVKKMMMFQAQTFIKPEIPSLILMPHEAAKERQLPPSLS